MNKQLILSTLFLLLRFLLSAQNESTSYPQNQNDSLNKLLYRQVLEYNNSKSNKSLIKIEKLIEQGADPNAAISLSKTYKKLAAYIPIIKEFYKHKYRTINYITTSFQLAVLSRDTQLVKHLIQLGAKTDISVNNDDYPIKLAAYNKDRNMIFLLLNHGADIHHVDLSKIDDIDLIEELVKKGADISTINWDFATNDINLLNRLIKLNPTFTNVQLNFEEIFQKPEIFDFLIDKGMPLSVENKGIMNCPVLFAAVKYQNLHALKRILSTGKVDINATCKNYFDLSPLIIAIEQENTKIIQYLLEQGANPMQKDWTKQTAINHTIFCKNPKQISKLLIDYGADIDYSGYFNQTPLMHAVKLDEYIAAKAYIELGADVNFTDKYGDSPLTLSVKTENLPMMQLLIAHNADRQVKIEGKSLLEYARKKELSAKIIEYLKTL